MPKYGGCHLGSRLVRALCQLIPLLCVTVIYLLLRLHALGGRLGARTQNLSWRTVARSVPATLWFYLKVLLWPVRLRAFADSSEVDTFSARDVLLPGLGVGCALMVIAAASLWAWKKTRDLPDR